MLPGLAARIAVALLLLWHRELVVMGCHDILTPREPCSLGRQTGVLKDSVRPISPFVDRNRSKGSEPRSMAPHSRNWEHAPPISHLTPHSAP